ncbi:beta-galactosidase [Agreia pratensis]|uniref:beta-galactosidase n=1 Tax=Agreia pratensis TaxID=150121 RepID=UPI00188AD6A5|nr:beta-galactosidase [Agreia pratensis]MBF4635788.1 beta-galactosidase [Agreia pratensis]
MFERFQPASLVPSRVLFGAAYYVEYQLTDRLETDLDLMAEAHFNVIRVGESVWSTWEPREGEFDLEWMLPVLDAAHARGISVILGTPTYAVPPWLQESHPEIAAHHKTGQPIPWGSRQEVDYSNPTFRFHAERVIRKIVARYASHPAVIGYQLDNEPGLQTFHNPSVFRRFVRRLKARYGTVEELNRAWGLTYWSHRIDDWSQLWTPDGNAQPQYDLAWRKFQADLTSEFISWQAVIVREYSRDDQFVTTCLQYPRPSLDDETVNADLDIATGNPYYGVQDRLDWDSAHTLELPWTTTGVPALFRQADRLFASQQKRFLVTETNAWTIGGPEQNYPPYPGQLRQSAFALIARGAAQIEYWQWTSLTFGTETYWGGVLPHSLKPGRIYREIADIGKALQQIGSRLDAYEPDGDVAIIWSTTSRFALDFMPPLNEAGGKGKPDSYLHIFDAFHAGVVEAGQQARILHTNQAHQIGAEELAHKYPVLIAPAMYAATNEDLQLLANYAHAGGHLVIGARTGYADEEARARPETAPAVLSSAAGVWYDEFSNLDTPLPVVSDNGFTLSPEARATLWVDGLILDGADTLVTYEHPQFGRFPAVTTTTSGGGKVTYVGTIPNKALAADIVRYVNPTPIAAAWVRGRGVTIASGTLPDGARVWFIHNWTSLPSTVTPPTAVCDLTSTTTVCYDADAPIHLEPWASLALVDC